MHLDDYFIVTIVEKQKLLYSKVLGSVKHEQYKAAMLYVVNLIRKYKLENWLIDSSATSLTLQDQRWATDELGELLYSTTLKQVALVHCNDLFMELTAENMRYKLYENYGQAIDLQHFSTIEEALNWISPKLSEEELLQQLNT